MVNVKLRRITDLFEAGELKVFGEGDGQVAIWVKRLNTFEREEALRDGRLARGLVVESYKSDPEYKATMEGLLLGYAREQIEAQLATRDVQELRGKAVSDMRSEDAWAEKWEIIERGALAEDQPEAQQKAYQKVVSDFTTEVQVRLDIALNERRAELSGLSLGEVQDKWREFFVDSVAGEAFHKARRKTEVFYALCDVETEVGEGGEVRAVKGGERPRLLQSRDEVESLPDELLFLVVDSLDAQMSEDEAKN